MSGSSPLARGLHSQAGRLNHLRRIIPARAGFTRTGVFSRRRGPDHPRSRGVYMITLHERELAAGSSPLARGLHFAREMILSRKGIIPARAGFTPPSACGSRSTRDHPRSRGVYLRESRSSSVIGGSSPLARGLPEVHSLAEQVVGIIPARAGFTPITGSPTSSSRDHPRSRGVYS